MSSSHWPIYNKFPPGYQRGGLAFEDNNISNLDPMNNEVKLRMNEFHPNLPVSSFHDFNPHNIVCCYI